MRLLRLEKLFNSIGSLYKYHSIGDISYGISMKSFKYLLVLIVFCLITNIILYPKTAKAESRVENCDRKFPIWYQGFDRYGYKFKCETGDLSVELWGKIGRIIYPGAEAIMRLHASGMDISSDGNVNVGNDIVGSKLNLWLKDVLRPIFCSLVDRVSIYWGMQLLDEWANDRFGINLTGAESVAQVYGYDIYIRYPKSEIDSSRRTKDILWILIHELVHVQQYEKWGKSLSNFGYN